jgi:hypothetical protein
MAVLVTRLEGWRPTALDMAPFRLLPTAAVMSGPHC